MPIENMRPLLRYDSTTDRLYVQLKAGGKLSTPDGAVTADIYSPDNTALLTSQTLTQFGSTAWYYRTMSELSTVATWKKAQDYRIHYSWVENSIPYQDVVSFDIVRQPWVEPIITTEDVDKEHPQFDGMNPSAWSDWSIPILQAHAEMIERIRRLEVDQVRISPSLILDRNVFARCQMAFAARNIAINVFSEQEDKQPFIDTAEAAWDNIAGGPFTYDKDDDAIADTGEDETSPSEYRFTR